MIKKSAQNTLPFRMITGDGIIEIEKGLYSKSVFFNDINYQIGKDEDKLDIFTKYGQLLNYFDPSLDIQITINNKNVNHEQEVLLKYKNDFLDKFRVEYNNIIKEQLKKGRNDITHEKYLTYTIRADNIKDARAAFTRYDDNITSNFKNIGSNSYVLSGDARVKILYDFFNPGNEELLSTSIKNINLQGITTKDIIAPDSFKFKMDYFMMGDKYARAIFLKTFPGFLNDRFVAELSDFSFNMMLTINIKSIAPDKAIKLVKKQIVGMEANKINYQKRAIKSGYSIDIIPSELEHSLKQADELLDDLLNKNQKMFIINLLLVHVADSLEDLNRDTEMIMSTARKYLCYMGKLKYQQEAALRSTIPVGTNKLKIQRTLTTDSTAIFMPFTSQELFHPDGIYYGINSISKNIILFDRKSLKNANGFILGTPGSGKSFITKKEIISVCLNTDDDIIVIDPEKEYSKLVKSFDGEVIKISANSNHCINPLDISEKYGGDDAPIKVKAEFILSLFECLIGDNNGLTAKQKTIIDRNLHKTYVNYARAYNNPLPTMLDFYSILEQQPEDEAKDLAICLEMYVKGSLSIFSDKTNINYNNRMVSYDISDLGEQLKTVGMLIILDNVWNRIVRNREIGRRTWLYIDESHLLFKNEYSANFLHKLFKRARKWSGIVTAVTQNVSELLSSKQAKTMLSNSDFMLLFNQSASDREELKKLLKISDTQMRYITSSEAGNGLLFTGDFIVPFVDKFPTNTRLYRLITTKPGEINLIKEVKVV